MKARFQVVEGAKARAFAIKLPTVIGRSDIAKVKLRSSRVSRFHCEIYEYKGQIAVKDLNSSNGTVVNGVRIEAPTLLSAEDRLQIGPVTVLVTPFEASTDTESQSPNQLAMSESSADDPDDRQQRDGSASSVSNAAPPMSEDNDAAPLEAAKSSAELATDVTASDSAEKKSGESVLNYSESSNGSFIGIEEVTFSEEIPPSKPSHSQVLGELPAEEKKDVAADDSALNSFLQNLD